MALMQSKAMATSPPRLPFSQKGVVKFIFMAMLCRFVLHGFLVYEEDSHNTISDSGYSKSSMGHDQESFNDKASLGGEIDKHKRKSRLGYSNSDSDLNQQPKDLHMPDRLKHQLISHRNMEDIGELGSENETVHSEVNIRSSKKLIQNPHPPPLEISPKIEDNMARQSEKAGYQHHEQQQQQQLKQHEQLQQQHQVQRKFYHHRLLHKRQTQNQHEPPEPSLLRQNQSGVVEAEVPLPTPEIKKHWNKWHHWQPRKTLRHKFVNSTNGDNNNSNTGVGHNAQHDAQHNIQMPRCWPRYECEPNYNATFKVSLYASVHYKATADMFPDVEVGGTWTPPDCDSSSQGRIALIVPFRDREAQLDIFIRNIIAFLRLQRKAFTIFVVEQSGTGIFNKAHIMNAGFIESQKLGNFSCFIFHDVDLVPVNLCNKYECPATAVRHLGLSRNEHHPQYAYRGCIGGASAFTAPLFRKINGFTNLMFGWGGEDDDGYFRVRKEKIKIYRYPPYIGNYHPLHHIKHGKKFPRANRGMSVSRVSDFRRLDGLTTVNYTILSVTRELHFTKILVKIDAPQTHGEIRPLYLKQMKELMSKFNITLRKKTNLVDKPLEKTSLNKDVLLPQNSDNTNQLHQHYINNDDKYKGDSNYNRKDGVLDSIINSHVRKSNEVLRYGDEDGKKQDGANNVEYELEENEVIQSDGEAKLGHNEKVDGIYYSI